MIALLSCYRLKSSVTLTLSSKHDIQALPVSQEMKMGAWEYLVFVAQEVHFGEQVDMWQLQLHHGSHGLQGARYELRGVAHKLAVGAVDGRDTPAVALEEVNKAAEDADV